MKVVKRTNVIYSYWDNKINNKIQSSTGVDIEGIVTPARVRAAVIQKWKKSQYKDGDNLSIAIEQEHLYV